MADRSSDPAITRMARWLWWQVRFYSLAVFTRLPFEHPRVQSLVKERFHD